HHEDSLMITIGVLTISDGVSKGERQDVSGEQICIIASQISGGAVISARAVVPDELEQIANILREWSDEKRLNLILTTGGTGLAPRDVTPEATKAVIEREAQGIAEALRATSLQYTRFAMLSRGVAGTRGR